jgi:hypothetical protein
VFIKFERTTAVNFPWNSRAFSKAAPFPPVGSGVHHLNLSGLLSFHHQADQCSCGKACRKCCSNPQHQVPLKALGCVIQEFFGGIAPLFCRTPHYSYTILYCISNRIGCTLTQTSSLRRLK